MSRLYVCTVRAYNRVMTNLLTWLSRQRFPYEPLITVEISRSNLIHNLHEFRKIAPRVKFGATDGDVGMVAPVLKSNAYGHGLSEVAAILRHEPHIPFFAVDSYFEAIALRSYGVRAPILIIGYTRPETIMSSRLGDTVFTVSSLQTLQRLESTPHPIPIHLKIDTGMHRQGILPEEVEQASDLLSENTDIVLRGICTHLCDADNDDPSFTESQIKVWNKIARRFKEEFSTLRYLHVSATDGHRYTGEIEANVSRLGLGLFGLTDGTAFMPALELKPVMRMTTIVTGLKKLHRDQTVGYGRTFKVPGDMTVATIPAGYYEGIDRRLSNAGFIGIDHEQVPCPIVGRVSMNITTIDVTHVPDARSGMSVTIVSDDPRQPNSIVQMAKIAGTIPYEIAVHIPAGLRRIVTA